MSDAANKSIVSDPIQAFVRQIQVRMSVLGITQADLARRLDVSRPVVTRFFKSPAHMRFRTMVGIADAVGLDLHVQFRASEKRESMPRCECCNELTSEAEMVARHGTLAYFEKAVHKAVPEFLSRREAEDAAERYRLDLAYAAARDEKKVAL